MTVDDLSAPLGQQPAGRQRRFAGAVPQLIAGALAVFVCVFAVWAIVAEAPFGGEPMAVVPIDTHAAVLAKKSEASIAPQAAAGPQGPGDSDGPAAAAPLSQVATGSTRTVTIIDGKTGARQEVVIPNSTIGAAPTDGTPVDQKFIEITPYGPIPRIAADGVRPAEAFARPAKPLPGKPDAPRIAIIVGGLGVSTSAASDAITKLPGPVTLAFIPYRPDTERLVARAREAGHEILLQVPMEASSYPGSQSLLTSPAPEQDLDRLHWLMSRFQGYVGIAGVTGARFMASEQSFAPILQEAAKRGLIFVGDGTYPRSVAGRFADANNPLFAAADVVLESASTPSEIDRALGRLEMVARERGVAVGMASALPVLLERIAKWAKTAERRGLQLVPITTVALRAKQS